MKNLPVIWYVFLLLKYRRPHKRSPHYRIALQKSLPPVDNLPVKIRPDRTAAGRGGFFAGKLSAGETFLEGDPIVGHQLEVTTYAG